MDKIDINSLKINFDCGYDQPIITVFLRKNILIEDISKFLSFYRFSKYKKGKFFLKIILKKIFKKRINSTIIWRNDFWNKIQVQKIKSEIHLHNSQSTNILMNYLSNQLSKKRMKNIINYKLLISEGVDLGYPLYIKGDCLNMLGGDVNGNNLFQVDGARRLMANFLNNKKSLYIWVITKKEEDF